MYHEEDDARPQYDHNRYGVELIEVGPNREVVIETLVDLLAINENEAQNIADSSPQLVLENVSVEEAIAAAQRLSTAGARCNLPITRNITLFDTSTADIPCLSGSYLVILHRTGVISRMVFQIVKDVLPALNEGEVEAMLNNTPCVILSGIALETAKMIKIRLSDFGATVVIQSLADREKLGQEIHQQNPNFRKGHWQVRLDGVTKYRKVAIIKELQALLPGSLLQEIIALIETIPCVVVNGVDLQTAQAVQDRLQDIGAGITLQHVPSEAGAETIEIPGGNLQEEIFEDCCDLFNDDIPFHIQGFGDPHFRSLNIYLA